MNFIRINNTILTFLFGLFLFPYSNSTAKTPVKIDDTGIPLTQKFPFSNFSLSSGKFSVYEDPSGIFLIGAQNKIIIFYGNEFLPIDMKGHINISSNQKSVFYTGYNSLGLIRLFKNSLPQFIPLVDEKRNGNKFGQINKVFISSDLIVFNNNNKLFVFDGSNISVIDSSKRRIQIFQVNDTIYEYKQDSGLYKFDTGKLILVNNNSLLINKNIQQVFQYKNDLLIKTDENPHFLKLKNQAVSQIDFGFEDFVDKAGFSDALILPNENIAIGTKSAGIIIYNNKTQGIRRISVNEGLLDNTVKTLHIDRAGNLWVLHEGGISRVELNIPATVYGLDAGISGSVADILKYNNNIYLATSNGVLKATYKSDNKIHIFNQPFFTPIEGLLNKTTNLFESAGQLIIATPTGIYKLNGDKAEKIFTNEINCITQSKLNRQKFYIGNEFGFSVYTFTGKSFEPLSNNTINGYEIIEIANENDSVFWLKTTENKLFKLSEQINSKNSFNKSNKTEKLPKGSRFHLLNTEDGLRFCFPDSVFSYNNITNSFIPEEVTDLKQLKGIPWLVESFTDPFDNKWFHLSSSLKELQGILMYKKAEKPVFFNTGNIFSPIYVDSSTVWLGGDNKLIKFDSQCSFNFPRMFSALIKRVIIGKDSLLNIGLEDPEINFKYNDIRFEVSSTGFEGEPYIRYQYQLGGKDKNWNNWSLQTNIAYKNLLPGEYNFKVRALNIDGLVSDETVLHFYILSPFYLSIPAYIIYGLILLFLVFLFLRWQTWLFVKNKEKVDKIVQERTEDILREKEKSEVLIANMLPKGTADELKLTGKATSQKFAMVTVLFSDIQGFTKIAEQMNPEMLIDQLDAFFFHFDSVVEKFNIEKIKTIGDAYMCAGGIPNKNITNPIEVVLAALEVQEYMRQLQLKNSEIWDLRIGIHTGSVIAGVVGHKKLSYDIWGDTVNTASRMESSGEPGKVNISGHTYDLVKDFFICEYRGKMPVKYKGEIDMYFVKSIRPELAIDMKHIPNRKFTVKLQLVRLQDIEEDIMDRASKELPANLYFHDLARMKDIYGLVELFCRAEDLSEEEALMVRTAALLHDVGYIWSYDEHEEESIRFAREILPKYAYPDDQIERIIELIECTKRLRKPTNKLEEILLDADMNYLSRADFITLNKAFYNELYEKNKIQNQQEWVRMQIVLLSNHKYYTSVANVLRDVSSEHQIENIIETSKKTDL